MESYELVHLAVAILFIVFGSVGGFYALRTLSVLYKSPEIKSQRKIWLPMLTATVFFSVGGFFHFADHTFYPAPEADLLYDIFIIIGFVLGITGLLQYAKLQIAYNKLKNAGLKNTQTKK